MSKRVFVVFAVEDKTYRDSLAGQAKLDKSPFELPESETMAPPRPVSGELRLPHTSATRNPVGKTA
jgi:hypothetical protein